MQRCILAILSLAFCAGAQAVSEDVQLNLVTTQGVGQTIGSVKITETDRGLEFAPTLRALPPGKHGFHIHAEGSCQPAMKEGKAVAAGAAGAEDAGRFFFLLLFCFATAYLHPNRNVKQRPS